MIYLFDSNSLISLFTNFYESRFPSLWKNFNELIREKRIKSVKEVLNEIDSYYAENRLTEWIKENKDIFEIPNEEELEFINLLLSQKKYEFMISKKAILGGKPVADPFIVAKAKVHKYTVVSEEVYKEKSVKIPNVCEDYNVQCTNLEGFMENEKWKF